MKILNTVQFLLLCIIVTTSCSLNKNAKKDFYHTLSDSLKVKGLPEAAFLLGDSEQQVYKSFSFYGSESELAERSELVISDSLPFAYGCRVKVNAYAREYFSIVLGAKNIQHKIDSGDVVLGVLYMRSVLSGDNSGTKIRMDIRSSDEETLYYREEEFPEGDWHQYFFPIQFNEAAEKGNWKIEISFAYGVQTIDIGGIAFINYGNKVRLEELPETKFNFHYQGRESDAKWRQQADERIDKYRKAAMKITVKDLNNKPVKGAAVTFKMKKHLFSFANIPGTGNISGENPYSEKYLDTFLEYFNAATIGTFKWPAWIGKRFGKYASKEYTVDAVEWCNKHNLPVHGHTLAWHKYDSHMELHRNWSAERKRDSILDYISEVLTTPGIKDNVYSWDVINHPIIFHEVWDDVGKDIMLEELKLAEKLDPGSIKFVNEGHVMIKNGAVKEEFKDLIRYFMENEVPLDGLGFMCHHHVKSLIGMDDLYNRLNNFASLDEEFDQYNLRLKVTEFDVNADQEDSEQLAIQADYTRDFFTMCFSHPDVSSICGWGFWKPKMWKPGAGMIDENWDLLPNMQAYQELVFKEWWTDETLITNNSGVAEIRGFKGLYDILISLPDGSKHEIIDFSVTKDTTLRVDLK